MQHKRGENLILYLFLLIVLIFLWISVIESAAYEEVKEPTFETIPQTEEVNTEEDGELFARTHEVICNEFTYEESQLLMGIAQAEAGNQGPDGMWLVMSVVLNRVNNPEFPDNILMLSMLRISFTQKA